MVRFVAYSHSSAWHYVAFSFYISSVWGSFVLLLFMIVASLCSLCLLISSNFSFLELCSKFRNSGYVLYVLFFSYSLVYATSKCRAPLWSFLLFLYCLKQGFFCTHFRLQFHFKSNPIWLSPVDTLHLTEVKPRYRELNILFKVTQVVSSKTVI